MNVGDIIWHFQEYIKLTKLILHITKNEQKLHFDDVYNLMINPKVTFNSFLKEHIFK